MASMVLSLATQTAINLAATAGPGANNQNYLAAYTAISNDIRANGGFNTGTLNWFMQAGLINTQAFSPTAQGAKNWGAHIRFDAIAEGIKARQYSAASEVREN